MKRLLPQRFLRARTLALLAALAPLLLAAGDDPRWRMRAAVAEFLERLQQQRRTRLEERLRQVDLDRAYARFAAALATEEAGTPLRERDQILVFKVALQSGRETELHWEDHWTRELADGALEQGWSLVERVRKPFTDQAGRRTYLWEDETTALVFRGARTADGSVVLVPGPESLAEGPGSLPPAWSRLLRLVGPDADTLLIEADESPR